MDGVTGIYSPSDSELVDKIFFATGALDNRYKESSGIAVGNGKGIYIEKDLGKLIGVVDHNRRRNLRDLNPIAAIGNVGDTKNKYAAEINTEPIEIKPKTNSRYKVVLTMDGYLIKEDDLKSKLESDYYFETRNKTEVVGALLHRYINEKGITFGAGKKLVDKLHGRATFSLTALVYDGKETHMLTLNDDKAFEPLCYGTIDDAFIVSSESCSHRKLGGFIEREYDGAEMTICSPNGIDKKRLRKETLMRDIFQGVYFGNPGSLFMGKEIYQMRKGLGLGLVKYYGASKGIVVPVPDSGFGVTMGIFEGNRNQLRRGALDFSKLDEGIIRIRDKGKYEQLEKLISILPALVRHTQSGRTFQEGEILKRLTEVSLKFGGIDSLLKNEYINIGDDSIVKGSVSRGGSVWVLYNAGAKHIIFWVSYPPMFFPSFKEWYRGPECLYELAVQKAFENDNPYDKTHDKINKAVAKLIGVEEVRYNLQRIIEKIIGKGSFQALDASYPISEEFWPDFIRAEVDKFRRYQIIKA